MLTVSANKVNKTQGVGSNSTGNFVDRAAADLQSMGIFAYASKYSKTNNTVNNSNPNPKNTTQKGPTGQSPSSSWITRCKQLTTAAKTILKRGTSDANDFMSQATNSAGTIKGNNDKVVSLTKENDGFQQQLQELTSEKNSAGTDSTGEGVNSAFSLSIPGLDSQPNTPHSHGSKANSLLSATSNPFGKTKGHGGKGSSPDFGSKIADLTSKIESNTKTIQFSSSAISSEYSRLDRSRERYSANAGINSATVANDIDLAKTAATIGQTLTQTGVVSTTTGAVVRKIGTTTAATGTAGVTAGTAQVTGGIALSLNPFTAIAGAAAIETGTAAIATGTTQIATGVAGIATGVTLGTVGKGLAIAGKITTTGATMANNSLASAMQSTNVSTSKIESAYNKTRSIH